MRVVSWNCNGAFHKKWRRLIALDPDVMIVQECGHSAVISESLSHEWEQFWLGDNSHRGLSIFVRKSLRPEFVCESQSSCRYMLAVRVGGTANIVGFWAMNNRLDPAKRYVGQVWTGLSEYAQNLVFPTIIAGDFNWNASFVASPPLCGTFYDVVDLLAKYGIRSVYHEINNDEFGKERDSTFFMNRKEDRGYHIDYAFLSERLMHSLLSFRLGRYDDWTQVSDHLPLILDVKMDNLPNWEC